MGLPRLLIRALAAQGGESVATVSTGDPTTKQLKEALQKVIEAVGRLATISQRDAGDAARMEPVKELLAEAESLIHSGMVTRS